MAGSAMILPECRWMWDGVEGADSLVLNAHKWLGVPFDCSLYFVRDPEHLVRVMSTNPSFLQSAVDGQVKNLRDWGIPLGRRFRALKLWFTIREQGVERCASGCGGTCGTRAGWRSGRGRRRGGACWRRSPCRRCACATSRPAWKARRWTGTRSAGRSG
jgi:glutamate/tyrosine decarboxylase-like PLP-dependent enzyme